MRMMMILLLASLSVSACTQPGNFCQVVKAPLSFDPSTAQQMVKTDRADVERITVQNTYGEQNCDW